LARVRGFRQLWGHWRGPWAVSRGEFGPGFSTGDRGEPLSSSGYSVREREDRPRGRRSSVLKNGANPQAVCAKPSSRRCSIQPATGLRNWRTERSAGCPAIEYGFERSGTTKLVRVMPGSVAWSPQTMARRPPLFTRKGRDIARGHPHLVERVGAGTHIL
jgi:hypothetical protein